MQFTGTNLVIKRNFYTQSGQFDFAANCLVDNTSGLYQFGLSGAQGVLEFKLQSGKMYYNNQFIHTYKSNLPFTIEGQFSRDGANIIKDNTPLIYSGAKSTGLFDYFYFKRENAGMNGSFTLNVSGANLPTYTIQNIGYLLTSGQSGVTGYFINSSQYPIKVFNTNIATSQPYLFNKNFNIINGNNSGSFIYSGDYTTIDLSQPILTTFNTNFGDNAILFTIIDARSLNKYVYFQNISDYSFNNNNILNRTLSYLNFSGGFATNSFNTDLIFSLQYISGYTGTFLNNTGFGATTGFFSGIGTGLASGLGFTGLASGYYTGLITGYISSGSGFIIINNFFTGMSIGKVVALPTGGNFATGYLDLTVPDNFTLASPINGYYFNAFTAPGSSCNTSNPNIAQCNYKFFPTIDLSAIASCLSGFPNLGIRGIVRNANIIDFSTTFVGTFGNTLFISGAPGNTLVGTGFLTSGINGTSFTGNITSTGTYTGYISNNLLSGKLIYYNKSFTGEWNLLTGLDTNSLISLKNFTNTSTSITGRGTFQPNSSVTWQINHFQSGQNSIGAALLTISGSGVLDPTYQILTN